ncbi:MAG: hypothetical protein FVQ82_06060 [Planctomycetes bacterium]|nr:hypothetical protein [Planctomycetota bacterium]
MDSKTMINVELIFDSDCPNVELAREAIKQALTQAGLDEKWREWDRADVKSPEYVQSYGSPTILVDRKDIAGESTEDSCRSCRVYKDENGRLGGIPPVKLIGVAIEKAKQASTAHNQKGGYKGIFAVVPSIGAVMIPGISCPACWPAYAGLLSAFGIGFVNYTPYLLPITVLFLMITVFALAFRAKRRRGYGPTFTGLIAAIFIIAGKFTLSLGVLVYSGIGLLIIASIWNLWPGKNKGNVSCSFCVPDGNTAKEK